MEKIVGTEEFLKIINKYKHENFILNRILKNTITKNTEDNIREVLMERNKNVNKHDMEEDESEKLTNFATNSNSPQKFKSVMMTVPVQEKRKVDRKEILKMLTKGGESEDNITSNFFDTSINNINKQASYNNFLNRRKPQNKLETIYEKTKYDTMPNDDHENKIINHNFKRKKNLSIAISDYSDNSEPYINKKPRVSSNYTNTDSVKTTCDSRLPSALRSDKDSFISILTNPEIGTGKL